jgi:phage shock protein C
MKRLYTSKDKKIAGVCGGIAEYFDIDASLVRLGWIVLTVITGIIPGAVAYVIAAIIIPQKPDTIATSKEL